MNKHDISILVIDDVSKVFEGLRERFSFVSAPYSVIEYLIDTSKKKETVVCEISDIIKNKSITHIISDRGFSVVENCEETQQVLKKSNGIEFQKIDELIESIIEHLSENSIKQIKSFIIYSYDPFSNKIRREFRILRANLAKKVSDKLGVSENKLKGRIKTIESSSIYKRPGKTGIYPNSDKNAPLIGSFQACKFYGEFLADVLVNIIEDERTQQKGRINPYSYSKPQNYEMLKQIRSLEDLINNKVISIGSVSCYGNIYGKEEYLVDVPYKSYYDNINKEITRVSEIDGKSDLSLIFYNNLDKKQGFVKYEYVYFKYSVFEEDALFLDEIKLSAGLKEKDNICKQWLPLLHSSVFFCQENSWKNDLLKCDEKPTKDPVSIVNIFFSIIKLEEDDFHGTYNFTLYSENPSINFEKIELYAYEKYAPLLESKLLELILPHKSKESKKQAIRAAISQVMARNMSHNIGSHVMNKLIDADYLEKFCSYSKCLKSYKPLSDFKETIDHTAFKQLAIYNNYVKCRMDYLSDMSFGTPLMQTSKKIWEDVYRGLDKVRLLLENISGLGGNFKYSIKLELEKDDGNIEEVNAENDFALALPNDILGCQAFYNIIENVIRNTAKHASKDPDEEIKFTIRFSEINDHSIAALETIEKEEVQGWMCVEIFDSIHVDDVKNLVNSQNEKMNKPILNESNQLRSNSLGLIEMEASAAYLRKIDSYSIDDDVYEIDDNEQFYNKQGKINVLKAVSVVCKKDETERHHLGYRFFMLKPQEVLIVTDSPLDTDASKAIDKEKALKKGGVWVVNSDKFVEHLNSGKVYNHQFVVYERNDNNTVKKAIEEHKTSLPIRVLDVASIWNWLTSVDYNAEQIIKYCWSSWIKKLGLAEGIIGNSVSCSCQKNQPEECSADGKFRVVLIDHDKDSWLKCKDCKKANFIEVLSSKALEKLPSLPSDKLENQNGLTPINLYVVNIKDRIKGIRKFDVPFNQILESSFTQIVVIDERIQKFAENEYTKGASYFDYFRKMKIILPLMPNDKEKAFEETKEQPKESRFNLSANEMDQHYSEALKNTLEYWFSNLKNNDIILMHYSLLERIFKKEPNKLDAINLFIESNKFDCQFILTTGRGIIPGLTPKARFINLSPVITAFVEIGNKHLINYILTSTRKL